MMAALDDLADIRKRLEGCKHRRRSRLATFDRLERAAYLGELRFAYPKEERWKYPLSTNELRLMVIERRENFR